MYAWERSFDVTGDSSINSQKRTFDFFLYTVMDDSVLDIIELRELAADGGDLDAPQVSGPSLFWKTLY